MMTNEQLRMFWALAKKKFGDEKEVRQWLFRRFGVWSPHDLRDDEKHAALEYLRAAEHDYYIASHPDNPVLDDLVREWLRERDFALKHKFKSGQVKVYPLSQEEIKLLRDVLHYFTPAMASELVALLAHIETFVWKDGWTEVRAVLKTFLEDARRLTTPLRKLPPRYLIRMLKAIRGARKRMWTKILEERLADKIAEEAFQRFSEATSEVMGKSGAISFPRKRGRPA